MFAFSSRRDKYVSRSSSLKSEYFSKIVLPITCSDSYEPLAIISMSSSSRFTAGLLFFTFALFCFGSILI